ncbi:hypothetical protein [Rudaea sp.]|uniref:hypothetical protein n=1 Tax=Rudaea sp. TaxID=2136325 RepID=UPI002ED1DB1A
MGIPEEARRAREMCRFAGILAEVGAVGKRDGVPARDKLAQVRDNTASFLRSVPVARIKQWPPTAARFNFPKVNKCQVAKSWPMRSVR